jgi:prophage antirepressor-like protein|nr:MAG TPA: repressor domain protein [Caudoviricetes sp.]
MNKIQIFENKEFGQVRSMTLNGSPWFVGRDVATALGYKNSRDALAKHVDEEDKDVAKRDTLGGEQEVIIINESGLYSLILSSKLPAAKRFKRWVTSEVLPAIHRTGEYRMKPKASEKPALPAEYEYFPKTFRGVPVMITPDIAHAVGKSVKDIASLVKRSSELIDSEDYKLLTGDDIREFERENPKLKPGHGMLYVIYRSGVEKLFGIWKPKEGAPMLSPPEPEFVDPVNDKAYMKLVDDIEYTMHFMSMLLRRSLKKKSYEDFKKLAVSIQNTGFEVADQAYHFTLWKPEGGENALTKR